MNESPGCVLEAVDVTKHYIRNESRAGGGARSAVVKSVDGVSLCLARGKVLGILGETGCGKSTLGRVLAGLEPPTSGSVALEGQSVALLNRRDRKALRRRAQMVFQNPFDTFDARHRIERVLVGALKLHGIGRDRAERLEMAARALEGAGLRPAENFLRRYPGELSGGQLQRIAILRSMLLGPKLIVADEPVSMLDVSVRADIINMLGRLAHEKDTAVVFISHDISTARYICDTIAVMYLGQIVEIGPAREVLDGPLHPYTRALVSNCPSADPRAPFQPMRLEGEPPSPVDRAAGCYFSPRCPEACAACAGQAQPLLRVGDGAHSVRCACAAGR